jgi:Na+/melibiose symporter-like transporter
VWAKGVIGIVLCAVGAVWVAQGTGAMHGSVMTGHSQYTALGIVVIVIGVGMVLWAYRGRRSHKSRAS